MVERESIRCYSVHRGRLRRALMGLVTLDQLDPGALTTRSIRASVIIADVDLRVLHVEGPAFARHGYQLADWPGRLLSEVLPPRLMGKLEPRWPASPSRLITGHTTERGPIGLRSHRFAPATAR